MPKAAEMTDRILNDLDNYKGVPILGYTVLWRAAGCEVNHTTLVELLDHQGFKDFAPAMPTVKRALRRAIVGWLRTRTSDGGATLPALDDDATGATIKRALIRPLNTAKSKLMSFTVIREDVDMSEFGLDHDTALRFILDKDSGDLCVTTLDGPPEVVRQQSDPIGDKIAAELRPIWDHYRELHTTADVLLAVRAIVLGSQSFSLRREGGVYFIAESKRPVVERLRGFFNELETTCPKGNAWLGTLPQVDLGGAKAQLALAAHTAMEEEIAGMRQYLNDAFISAKPGSVKPASIAKQIELFKAHRAKIEAYHDLLGMRQSGVAAQLDELTQLARSVVLKTADAVNGETSEEGGDEESESE